MFHYFKLIKYIFKISISIFFFCEHSTLIITEVLQFSNMDFLT